MKKPDLKRYGIDSNAPVLHNPSYQELFELETSPQNEGLERGVETKFGAVAVETGRYTGRAPKDRYIVRDAVSENTIWWDGEINRPVGMPVWHHCKNLVVDELSQARHLFVVDAFCGINPDSRLKVRFVVEVAWQAHFVTNMFVRPTLFELQNFGEPDFVVLNSSRVTNPQWKEQGLNSEIFVLFNLTDRIQLIGGTWYGGEMKKGIFSMMNYYLPLRDIGAMHCSANVGEKGDVALFFGLSGTGKTTLSADPKRYLIGDDEHGWDEQGIFNFEGGSYAKTINLNADHEPDIWRAIRRDALLENVVVDAFGNVDFSDDSITENSRVSYPIYFINKIVLPSKAGHAKKIIYLSADAFGVLPPFSYLDKYQAQYYFLCGYTAKLAGTEHGIVEPLPSFSPAFGAAFLSLHPTVYAKILAQKMEKHGARAYLVNTGWNGTGKRISLADTRKIIDAILDDSIDAASRSTIPVLNLEVPDVLNGINSEILDPRNSYADVNEWVSKAEVLAGRFIGYFSRYTHTPDGEKLVKYGPSVRDL